VLDTYAGHLRRFRDHELLAELRDGYEQISVRRLGFPSMRLIVWAYTSLLKLTNRSHASQSQALWREPGPAKRLAVAVFYRLLKFDNLFARLPLGATLVVRARKCDKVTG
jgi:hypothetical protein